MDELLNVDVSFDNYELNVGRIGHDEVITWLFKCTTGNQYLEYVYTSCPCIETSINSDGVEIELRGIDVVGSIENGQVKPFNKFVYCKIKGEPEFIANEFGKRIENPKVRKVRFKIFGQVIG